VMVSGQSIGTMQFGHPKDSQNTNPAGGY